jgi:hypothetical protein
MCEYVVVELPTQSINHVGGGGGEVQKLFMFYSARPPPPPRCGVGAAGLWIIIVLDALTKILF